MCFQLGAESRLELISGILGKRSPYCHWFSLKPTGQLRRKRWKGHRAGDFKKEKKMKGEEEEEGGRRRRRNKEVKGEGPVPIKKLEDILLWGWWAGTEGCLQRTTKIFSSTFLGLVLLSSLATQTSTCPNKWKKSYSGFTFNPETNGLTSMYRIQEALASCRSLKKPSALERKSDNGKLTQTGTRASWMQANFLLSNRETKTHFYSRNVRVLKRAMRHILRSRS